jgi:hypothetical protein
VLKGDPYFSGWEELKRGIVYVGWFSKKRGEMRIGVNCWKMWSK